MKKLDVVRNTKNVSVVLPEPIDGNETISLVDHILPRNKEHILDYSKVRRFGEETLETKIGGTTYAVSTHFNLNGRQCVLEQFKQLILSENLI